MCTSKEIVLSQDSFKSTLTIKIIFNKIKDELCTSDISSAFFSWAFLFSSWKMYLANTRAPLPQRLQNQMLKRVCEYRAQIFPRLVPGLGGLGYGLLCIPTMIAFYYTVIMAWAFYFMFQVTTTVTSLSLLGCCVFFSASIFDRRFWLGKTGLHDFFFFQFMDP